MNEKEIAEIRRRFAPDKNNITRIRGCYVNEKNEIVSEFDESLLTTPAEEAENLLATLRRTLSGTPGKQLTDVTFATAQVVDSEEHHLLMTLKNSELTDETAVHTLFTRAIEALALDENYLILLTLDKYDVPYRAQDGERQPDASSEVYTYLLCSVCPIKQTKSALGYYVFENTFRNCKTDWLVAPPVLGFLFPAFDDRTANIYNALYYARDPADNHPAFADMLFRRELPMPAPAQKETFENLLGESLAEECSLAVVQAVHGQLYGLISDHKANKDPTPLAITRQTVRAVLEDCGVSPAHADAFDESYDAAFGADATLAPQNLIDAKQLELRTPDVRIQVSPDRRNLVETRVIDGAPYILIRADERVEVNGVPISFPT